jgi:hydroxyacyl-ACP dehydratase HTD2-like protein with hotdog domain
VSELAPEVGAALGAAGLDPELPAMRHEPSPLALFRFSAVTWNSHRIHYDEAFAREEGHDGLLVQSTLRGHQLLTVVQGWLGERGSVSAFSWRNLRPALAGREVMCRGRVSGGHVTGSAVTLTVELQELDGAGRPGAAGTATVQLERP